MAGKKKSLAGTIKREFDLSQEGKAIKAGAAMASELLPGKMAKRGYSLGKSLRETWNALDRGTNMTEAQEKEYKRAIGMSAKAWAREKKKAEIKD